jgi:hypothetical protein
MKKDGYKNKINLEEEGLYNLKTTPDFWIGQTAYLIKSDGFNLLWNCIVIYRIEKRLFKKSFIREQFRVLLVSLLIGIHWD